MTGVNAVEQKAKQIGIDRVHFHDNVVTITTRWRPSIYNNASVPEPDFYRVVLTSQASNAQPALDFVCGQLLPSIASSASRAGQVDLSRHCRDKSNWH
jgi:hypothetical protein